MPAGPNSTVRWPPSADSTGRSLGRSGPASCNRGLGGSGQRILILDPPLFTRPSALLHLTPSSIQLTAEARLCYREGGCAVSTDLEAAMSRRHEVHSAAWLVLSLTLALSACGGIPEPASPQPLAGGAQDTLPPLVLEAPQEGMTLVYLFNASGWTLMGSGYTITVDGQRVAHLPRETYTWVQVAPGRHKMEAGPARLELTFEPGRTLFVAVAYNPGKSWAAPFAGKPFVFQEVDEPTALVMLRQFRYQAPDARAVAVSPT